MKFRCKRCSKKLGFFQLYGSVLKPFTHYCQMCWAERDVIKKRMDLEDAKLYLKQLQELEKIQGSRK